MRRAATLCDGDGGVVEVDIVQYALVPHLGVGDQRDLGSNHFVGHGSFRKSVSTHASSQRPNACSCVIWGRYLCRICRMRASFKLLIQRLLVVFNLFNLQAATPECQNAATYTAITSAVSISRTSMAACALSEGPRHTPAKANCAVSVLARSVNTHRRLSILHSRAHGGRKAGRRRRFVRRRGAGGAGRGGMGAGSHGADWHA